MKMITECESVWRTQCCTNAFISPISAILYECVKTIYTIHPKSELLEKAAKCIGKFVLSPKINLKYLGMRETLTFSRC